MELSTPDPFDVDPSYSLSAPPRAMCATAGQCTMGGDRHVAITLHDPAPLKASLEANCNPHDELLGTAGALRRDKYGNGWEFGPPATYEGATRLFPPYLALAEPEAAATIGWGG